IYLWLRDGACGDAEFRSGDTVYFYFQSDRDCKVTIIKVTPWREKTLVKDKEIIAGKQYLSSLDIGTGVTRSGWWEIVIIAKDNSGEEARAECSFYVPYVPKTGDIKVIVEDQDGNRIESAKIYINGDYQGVTDYDGEYFIEDLTPDSYTIRASKSGYEDDNENVYVESGETKTVYLTLYKECMEGYTGHTRCSGCWIQREYQYSDCTKEWKNYENCDEKDGYVGDYYCKNGDVYRKYRDYYCENGECRYREEEKKIKDCDYGCEDGGCVPSPPPTTTPVPTTYSPSTSGYTTTPTLTTTPPTTLYTSPSSHSSPFVYIGIFTGIIVLFLGIFLMSRKKSEKIKEKWIEKEPKKEKPIEKPLPKTKYCPFCGKEIPMNSKICPYCKKDLEVTPELKRLLEEEKKWKEELERLKARRSELEEKAYEEKYNEIMDKLVDIKDRIIQEKIKGRKKK
ncbi:MAG TPA: PEGA domain-containing protein, partial [Methanomicrobia archaeon]|nr:PEGA domain-containing protein [Methanomicrobia archaeon]